jgi:phosphate/phosphite/phosphonate ABC transporter binding protein
MRIKMLSIVSLTALLMLAGAGRAETPASKKAEKTPRVLTLGAVASGPSSVTMWRDMRYYLGKNGLPIEFVLYSTYDGLVKALQDGQVDIAWNTPLAHAQFHRLAGDSQALVMRDVDRDFRSVLLVRKDAGITDLPGLAGQTVLFGSCNSAECTVLPAYFLKKEGVRLDQIKVLSLHKEVDRMGVPCHSERHVLKALREKRGGAGIINERLWKYLQKDKPEEAAAFQAIWTSPASSHCMFTARKNFHKDLGARFTRLMLAMDAKDPVCAEILRLEGCQKWAAGGQEGYEHLLKALRDEDAVSLGK